MSSVQLFLIAFGLSMDAFAVSVTNGLCCRSLTKPQTGAMALCFGIFQGIMPVIGYYLGMAFASYIMVLDHYIALLLLSYIGGRMILDALRCKTSAESYAFSFRLVLLQGFATSVDALAVGISFAALAGVSIAAAAMVIASVTFLCAIAGIVLGVRFGSHMGGYAQIVGGLILIGIGVKIFCEHMLFTSC